MPGDGPLLITSMIHLRSLGIKSSVIVRLEPQLWQSKQPDVVSNGICVCPVEHMNFFGIAFNSPLLKGSRPLKIPYCDYISIRTREDDFLVPERVQHG